jgi:interleukin-like EMT inducer protein/membrane protein YfhO
MQNMPLRSRQSHRLLPGWKFLPDLAAVVLLAVLPFMVLWRLWAPNPDDRVLLIGDFLVGAYPTRVFVHRLLGLGEAPLWNPYQLGGMPLLADVQVAVTYVPNLLLDLLYWGRDIPYQAFEALDVAHYALGALFLYAYLRNMRVEPASALVGAIAFEFSGFFVGHRGHYNMLAVVVWLPGVLWLLDCAWRAARFWRGTMWAGLAGLALSQMVMAGHPQLAFYCALFVMAYFGYRWVEGWRGGWQWLSGDWAARWRHPLVRIVVFLGIAGVLSVGMSAIVLFPTAELLGRSMRSEPSFSFSAQYALMPRNLIGLLMPEFLNWSGTEFRIYAGILTLVLAGVAWVVPDRARPERTFFSAALVVSLVVALGAFTSLHGILYRFLPGFSSSRVVARAFYFGNLSLAVLAAFGAEVLFGALGEGELRRLARLIHSSRRVLIGVGLVLSAAYLLLVWNYQDVGEAFYFYESLLPMNRPLDEDRFSFLTQVTNVIGLFALLVLGSVTLLWVRRRRSPRRGFVVAICLLMVLDVTTFAPYHDTVAIDPQSPLFAIKEFSAETLTQWEAQDRDDIVQALRNLPDAVRVDNSALVLPENYGHVWGIPFSTGYNILDLKERFGMRMQWPYLSDTLEMDLLHVGYVLSAPDDPDPPEEGAQLILENSQGKLWQRARQPAFATFSTRLRPAESALAVNGLLALVQTWDTQPSVSAQQGTVREVLARSWPEGIDSGLYSIGDTGVRSPVDISVLAGGVNGYSVVLVDGVAVTPEKRGIVFAAIDPVSGEVLDSGGFDTYLSEAESNRLASVLGAVPGGAIVALATYDEGTAKLTDAARVSLAGAGAAETLRDRFGYAYAMIGVQGSDPGAALEHVSPDPLVLDVGIGAARGVPDEKFASELLSYHPNRITLAVENGAHGLLTVSEPVYPGWDAFVDGTAVPILRANGMFRAVVLPPGAHQVTFVFRPDSVRLGGAISVVSLSLAIGLILGAFVLSVRRGNEHENRDGVEYSG